MNKRVMCLSVLVGLASMVPVGAQNGEEDGATLRFRAFATGLQEVVPPEEPTTPSPGIETEMSGRLRLAVARDLSELSFRLDVLNGVQVTQAHLHCGRAGVNGPVVVFLAPLNTAGEDVNGLLAEGTRTNTDIEEGAADCEEVIGRPIRNIASLVLAARDGLIYVNVHTVANPAGEVRGQLLEVELLERLLDRFDR